MTDLLPKRQRPRRLYSGLAVMAGVVLLLHEIPRLRSDEAEAWFWLLVAGLMIVMGLIGVFQQPPDGGLSR